MKSGAWHAAECRAAWDGNGSWDSFVAHAWRGLGGDRLLIAVNYAPHPSQCYVDLPFLELRHRSVVFQDLLSPACYRREGNEVLERGLYLDLQPWSYHVFDLKTYDESHSRTFRNLIRSRTASWCRKWLPLSGGSARFHPREPPDLTLRTLELAYFFTLGG